MVSPATGVNKHCRLCLDESSDRMHHIFDEGLSNKIIILSGLDVMSSDALPKSICRECRYQLEKSFYFRVIAKKSDARLRKHIRLVNQKKPSNVLTKEYQGDDLDEEFDETIMDSYKYFEEAEREIQNMRLEFETYKESIIQDEVDRVREEIAALVQPKRNNSQAKTSPRYPPVVLNKQARSPLRFQCSPTIRRKVEQIETPVNEINLADYQIEFVTSEPEETHQVQVYDDTQIEVINEEEQIEEDRDSQFEQVQVKRRKKSSAKDAPKKSPANNKVESIKFQREVPTESREIVEEKYFKTIEDSTEALDANGEKKIFQCAFENCSEKFARRQACKTHYFNHQKSKSVTNGYTCAYCQKVFKVLSAFERHERVHTGVKPFKCDVEGCEKAFTQNEMLKRHKVIHLSMEEAPFACNICSKKFRQKEPLRQHINKLHSEDSESKPHVCTFCQKQFAHSSGLSRHLLIHSGRKFTCDVCDKVFNDQSALKRHGSIHTK